MTMTRVVRRPPTVTDETRPTDDTDADRADRSDPARSDRVVEDTAVITVETTAEPADTSPTETTPATAPTTASGLPYELVIAEQWFYPSGDGLYDFGGIVENTGTQTATGFIEIEIDFFDDTGRILSTESAFVDTVVPGLRTPFIGLLIEPPAAPTRMEVRLADDNFIEADAGAGRRPDVRQHHDRPTTSFTFEVSGDATSTFTENLDFVQIVALWRDAGGAVIFSATQYLDRVPAGSTVAFTITVVR